MKKVIKLCATIVFVMSTMYSCDKNNDNDKKDDNSSNTTVVQDWNHLTPQQKQEVKDAAYAEYDQDPEGFELGVGLVYTMTGKNPPASLNPHNWSDTDWENFLELSEEMAKMAEQYGTEQNL